MCNQPSIQALLKAKACIRYVSMAGFEEVQNERLIQNMCFWRLQQIQEKSALNNRPPLDSQYFGMSDQTALLSTSDNKQLRLSLQHDTLTVEIQNPQDLEIYRGVYNYQEMPNQFQAIFDNLQEFYLFAAQAQMAIEEKTLIVPAVVVGKTKMLRLPLEEVQLTGEWKLKKDVLNLQAQLAQKDEQNVALLAQKDQKLTEVTQQLMEQIALTKERERENLILNNRIRHLENSMDELMSDKARSQNNQFESKLTQEYTPAKKPHIKSKKARDLQDYGRRLVFKIDDRGKHFGKFKIIGSEVQKLHGPTFQLFHTEPLPKEGRFYFDIKILTIRNNNIVVGVITDLNKEAQFSFKKPNSVCYNGFDGSICEQDKQSYVTVKPKEGTRLRTVVDMTLAQVEWYIMGGELNRMFIGKAMIPPVMTKQPLYPYFQLYWEGNKVKLNV